MVQGMLMGTEASVSLDGVLGRDLVDTSSGFEPVSESYGGEEKHQYCTECVVKLRAAPGGDTRRRAGLGGEGEAGEGRGHEGGRRPIPRPPCSHHPTAHHAQHPHPPTTTARACPHPGPDSKGAAQLEKDLADPKFGDSMVCVCAPCADGSGELAKVHIHSDTPSDVFKFIVSEYGKSAWAGRLLTRRGRNGKGERGTSREGQVQGRAWHHRGVCACVCFARHCPRAAGRAQR